MQYRLIALLILCIFFAPTSAFAKPLLGVWLGNIGKQSITACFNAGDYSRGTGSYFYQQYLIPIRLQVQTDLTSKVTPIIWKEGNGDWIIDQVSDDLIHGNWMSSDKSRTLPIQLTRVREFSEMPVSDSDACGSDAYNHSLEKMPRISLGHERSVNGIKYREISVNVGSQKNADYSDQGLHMATIELLGDETSVAAINKSLRKLMPTTESEMSELFSCRRAQLSSTGDDGFRTQVVQGVSVVKHWLILTTDSQGYCATAHPSIWETSYIFDLRTGDQMDLIDLFKEGDSNSTGDFPKESHTSRSFHQ
jgi:hypothetical protein